MRKKQNRVMSFLLSMLMLITTIAPLGGFSNAAEDSTKPVLAMDFLKATPVVTGDNHSFTKNADGSITVSKKTDATPADPAGDTRADGVFLEVNKVLDIASNPYVYFDIVPDANTEYSVTLYYQRLKTDGTTYEDKYYQLAIRYPKDDATHTYYNTSIQGKFDVVTDYLHDRFDPKVGMKIYGMYITVKGKTGSGVKLNTLGMGAVAPAKELASAVLSIPDPNYDAKLAKGKKYETKLEMKDSQGKEISKDEVDIVYTNTSKVENKDNVTIDNNGVITAVNLGKFEVTAKVKLKGAAADTIEATDCVGGEVVADMAAAPTATPAAGTYTGTQKVTLASTTADAKIYYTKDGSIPRNDNRDINGIEYSDTTPIVVDKNMTIKAIAMKSGMAVSDVVSFAYAVQSTPIKYDFRVVSPYLRGVGNDKASYDMSQSTDFSMIAGFVQAIRDKNVSYNPGNVCESAEWKYGGKSKDAVFLFNGQASGALISPQGAWGSYVLKVPTDGIYNISSELRYGSGQGVTKFFLAPVAAVDGGADRISNDYLLRPIKTTQIPEVLPPGTNASDRVPTFLGQLALTAGEYYFTYQAAENPCNEKTLYQWLASVSLTPTTVCPIPEANPASGTDFRGTQVVTLTTATKDAKIYYTLDGKDPTAASKEYTAPITLDKTSTIKAIAIKAGMSNSPIATLNYTNLNEFTLAPNAVPFSGYTFVEPINVTLNAETGAKIYYTTDGTTPTTSSDVYSNPIPVSKTTTIKAFAAKENCKASEVVSYIYNKIAASTDPIVYDFRIISPVIAGTKADIAIEKAVDYKFVADKVALIPAGDKTFTGSAPWCYGGKEANTTFMVEKGSHTLGARVNPTGKWASFRINVPQTGDYTVAATYWDSDTYVGDISCFLNPVSGNNPIADTGKFEKNISVTKPSNAFNTTTLAEKKHIEAGEYYFSVKLGTPPYFWVTKLTLTPQITTKPLKSAVFSIPSNFNAQLDKDKTYQTELKLLDADNKELSNTGADVKYVIEPKDAVTIDDKGVITAKVPGKFTITANVTLNGNSASDYITGAVKPVAPTADPATGATFTDTQKVTLTTGTPNADIYYTTDGSAPTVASNKYTGPFTISKTTTVKAIAVIPKAEGLNLYHPATPATYKDGLVINKVDTAPTINGVLDESSWEITNTVQAFGASPSTAKNKFAFTWDDTYLYVAVTKKLDSNRDLVPSTAYNVGDNIELLLDPAAVCGNAEDNITPIGGGTAKNAIALGAGQLFIGYKDGIGANIFTTWDMPKISAIKSGSKAVVKKSADNTAINFEVALPWSALQITPKNGEFFGLNVVNEVPCQVWTDNNFTEANFWLNTSCTGKIVLNDSEKTIISDVASFTYTKGNVVAPKTQSYEWRVVSPWRRGVADAVKGTKFDMSQVTSYDLVAGYVNEINNAKGKLNGGSDNTTSSPEGFLGASDPWMFGGAKDGKPMMFTDEDGGVFFKDIGDWGSFVIKVEADGTYNMSSRLRFHSTYGGIVQIYLAPKADVNKGANKMDAKYLVGTVDAWLPRVFSVGDNSAPLGKKQLSKGEYYVTYNIMGKAEKCPTPYVYVQNFKLVPDSVTPSQNPIVEPSALTFNDTVDVLIWDTVKDTTSTYNKGRAFYKIGGTFEDPKNILYMSTPGYAADPHAVSDPIPVTLKETTTIHAVATNYNKETKTFAPASAVKTVTYTKNAAPAKVATPTADPVAGNYSTSKNVTLSCAIKDADIYYTTDNTAPEKDGKTSTKYTAAIPVTKTTTIKAIAVKSGLTNSEVATFAYTITPAKPLDSIYFAVADPHYDAKLAKGKTYATVLKLRDKDKNEISKDGAIIEYVVDNNAVTVDKDGVITAKTVGEFKVTAKVTLNGIGPKEDSAGGSVVEKAADTPTANLKSGSYTGTQKVKLTSTGAIIYYRTDGSIPTNDSKDPKNILYNNKEISIDKTTTIKAIAFVDGMAISDVAIFDYTITPDNRVAAPTADPKAGTYVAAQKVKLTSATTDVEIYYTTDNSAPAKDSKTSTKYTKEITVDKTTTIKAIAIKSGKDNSEVATFAYTIKVPQDKVAAPTADPAAGNYKAAQKVKLTSATKDADIYYTIDGSAPTDKSTKYTKEIAVDKTTTIKAIAVKNGMDNSDVVELKYTITRDNMVIAPNSNPVSGTTFKEVLNVKLSSDTTGATIYYTTDGKDPTTSSTKYTTPIVLKNTTTIKAIAVKDGMINSDVVAFVFTKGTANQVETPTTNPVGGLGFSSALAVRIECATAGAKIYYTVDGSIPTTSSNEYKNKEIILTNTTTIKAIAVKAGMTDSVVMIAPFTLTNKPSSGSGSINRPNKPDKPDKPNPPTNNQPTIASTTAKADVDNKGVASVTASQKDLEDSIKVAKETAKKDGTTDNGIELKLKVKTDKEADKVDVKLSKEVLSTIASKDVKTFNVVSDKVNVGFDTAAIAEVKKQASGDVNLSISKVDTNTLAPEAAKMVGTRPVFDLKVGSVSNFGQGKVFVAIPYKLAANENADELQAAYITKDGKVEILKDSAYNSKTGCVEFYTNHFSIYGVVRVAKAPAFMDTVNHWAKDDIAFVATQGILGGTGKDVFSPDLSMTRGMFVTALGRLAGADVSGFTTSSFKDVQSGKYYLPYIEWAVKNGIVKGIGNGKFAPDKAITREEMAVIMTNYAKQMSINLQAKNAESRFADSASISAWARDAVKAMQTAGIIGGKGNNKFDPKGTATRAEVSAVLRRFMELVGA